jgi:putative endonuclease
MQERASYVYILTNMRRSVLYIGITSNLQRRIEQHRQALVPGFTQKYHLKYLIYYEEFQDILIAIAREKELKGWRRSKKETLITSMNPEWEDLTSS